MSLPIAGSVTSSVHATESLLFLVLLQLTIIVLAGRAVGVATLALPFLLGLGFGFVSAPILSPGVD
jgi:hypothetical protein